jgi:hypothetical protein
MKQITILTIAAMCTIASCTEKTIAGEDIIPEINKPQTAETKTIAIDKSTNHINVMGTDMPTLPSFPKLQKKPGKVLGYVKDWAGKPIVGASIGVRSSYLAGYYSGSKGITDSKGYFEFSPAKGSSEIYNAGYQIEYANDWAAVSLHPADGSLETWTTSDGMVENFVLLPYGITNREDVQNNPRIPSAYYGGAIILGWYGVEANDENAPDFAIKEGTIIEIGLTPESKTINTPSTGHSFTIRKVAGAYGELRIHNIPIGVYRISIKADGKAVKIKDNKNNNAFGLKPSAAIGSASISFLPSNTDASMITPQLGAWDWVSLNLEPNN